jgi:hypothetical protein
MHSSGLPSGRQALAVLCVLALLVPGLTAGAGAPASDDGSAGLGALADSPPTAAANETDCVESVVGFAYERHFSITCDGSDPADVTVEQHDGWAYVTIVELPQEYEGKYVGGKIYWRSSRLQVPTPIQSYWRSRIPLQGDEAAFVRVTQDAGREGRTAVFWKHRQRTDTLELPPGSYRVELWGYSSTRVSRSNVPNGEGMEVYDELVSRTPKRTSSLTLEIGGCDEDFDATARLNDLDRRQLETIAEIAAIKAEWASTRRTAAMSSAGAGALFTLGVIGAVEVGGAVLAGGSVEGIAVAGGGPAAIASSALDAKNLGGLPDEAKQHFRALSEKRRQLLHRYRQAYDRLASINQQYTEAVDKIRTCNGGQYEKPEGYQPITAEDRADARQAGREGR